jgi:hypothetical protein
MNTTLAVQCISRHVVKRFFILGAAQKLGRATASDDSCTSTAVSRRSILPTGNLATMC